MLLFVTELLWWQIHSTVFSCKTPLAPLTTCHCFFFCVDHRHRNPVIACVRSIIELSAASYAESEMIDRFSIKAYNTELLICMTDDPRTVGMPISFMCACLKFVIRRSSQFYSTQRAWQPSWLGCNVSCFTVAETVRCANQKLLKISSIANISPMKSCERYKISCIRIWFTTQARAHSLQTFKIRRTPLCLCVHITLPAVIIKIKKSVHYLKCRMTSFFCCCCHYS